jgi:hypothetical protein
MSAIHDIEDKYGSIAETDHPLAMMLHEVIEGGKIAPSSINQADV